MRQGFYERNGCQMFSGEATFIDEQHISVRYADGSCDVLSADKIVIATGSRPYCPSDVDFNHSRIYNSDTILNLTHELAMSLFMVLVLSAVNMHLFSVD